MFLTTLCNKAVCSGGDVTSYVRVNLRADGREDRDFKIAKTISDSASLKRHLWALVQLREFQCFSPIPSEFNALLLQLTVGEKRRKDSGNSSSFSEFARVLLYRSGEVNNPGKFRQHMLHPLLN